MMIPSEEKCEAMAKSVVKMLEADLKIKVRDPRAARRLINGAVTSVVKELREISELAKDKIENLSRNVMEGSREYDELYLKHCDEERRRRGL
jgi:hypothetical protein